MYDSREDTLRHIATVEMLIDEVISHLMDRAKFHDASKLESPEKEAFDVWTPKLSDVTYGSGEYRSMLKQMRPAIDHHQQSNRHHPEYFGEKEIAGMDLVDVVEMLCDWKAASLRHKDGDINKSIGVNTKRFHMPQILVDIFNNTIINMKW